MFGTYFAGSLSDTYGRKPLIVGSIAGTAVGFVLMLLSWNLESLYAARVWGGLFANSLPIAQACVVDVMPPEERPKYLGLIGATIGIGFTLGPGIGALIFFIFEQFLDQTAAQRAVLGVCAFISCLSCANAAFLMEETRPPATEAEREEGKPPSGEDSAEVTKGPTAA